jgi:hypothetical protein
MEAHHMKFSVASSLLVACSFALSGCVAGMALSAASMAARSARGTPVSNEHLLPVARQACTERAAQYGTVQVIDIQPVSTGKIIMWGTATNSAGRQSFECRFGTKITGFKLRPIPTG